MVVKKFQDFTGGLNLSQSSVIDDNQFVILKNMYYNNAKQLQTRRGYRKFGNQIGSAPITSYFFHQRDDTGASVALCMSGTNAYSYDGTTWNSVSSTLLEYETLPSKLTDRTRRSFAVYNNDIYCSDGVNPYSKFDGTTFSNVGVTGASTVTFDHTTDYVNLVAHGWTEGEEVFFTSTGTLPAEINSRQVYYTQVIDVDNFQISTIPGGSPVDFTDNGTGTASVFGLTNPRCRYIQFIDGRMFGAGDDQFINTIYYNDKYDTNADDINAYAALVGGDEQGEINGISEYSQVVVLFRNNKIYGFTVDSSNAVSSEPIDTQSGGYADRSIANVGNSLVYMTEKGIDTLVKRSGVGSTSAIEGKPLSDNVRELLKLITEEQYNANCGIYIKKINNYYFAFDTNGDNIPDAVLVYNSLVKAWSQYVMPPIYDFGEYINDNSEKQFLFASAAGGQMFEFEYGYDDNGIAIDTELETKPRDFDDPAQLKTFDFVDVTGHKQENGEIVINAIVDGIVVSEGMVTDDNINIDERSGTIGVDVLTGTSLGSGPEIDGLPVYKFTVRLPLYYRGSTISVNMSASGVQWIVEKMRVSVKGEVKDIFSYGNIL